MDRLDLVISKIDDLKENHGQRMDSIDENLREHMRRTDVLEALHRDNQKKIEKLEEPRKFMRSLRTIALYVAAIGGAYKLLIVDILLK